MAGDASSSAQEVELNKLIKKHLDQFNFVRTSELFVEEAKKLEKINGDVDEDSEIEKRVKECKTELLDLFIEGNDSEFFRKLEGVINEDRRDSSPDFFKLEFYLQLHFTVFLLRKEDSQPTREQLGEKFQKFKIYLEDRGSALSQEPEFLPYFALPYIQNPTQHSSLKDLFEDSWVANVYEQLDVYLSDKLQETFKDLAELQHGLLDIYEDYCRNQNYKKKLTDMQMKVHSEQLKLLKLQDNYQKLMHITTELLSALETSVRGEEVNLSSVMDTCLCAFPDLFTANDSGIVFSHQMDSGSNSNGPGYDFKSYRRSKTQALLLVPLDYKKLKRDLINGPPRLKMFILQALRWRLTRSQPGDQRRSVFSTFISNDVLGVRGGDYGESILSLVMTATAEIQQSMARLLNSFASLTSGRSYLAHSPHILSAITDNIKLNNLENVSLDMSLATLQKLSLRRQQQSLMINQDIIDWLLSLLEDEDALSDYALEYAVALLMNLCLRTAGKQSCAKNPRRPLKILTNLLGNPNQEIIPYVNGTLYSLLTVPAIKREAQGMGLGDMLNCFMKESNSEMKRQLEFILKQLSSDDSLEEILSDYEDEDDDDEDQDVLEEELDKDDLIVILPGELQGEQLLATHYTMAFKSKHRLKHYDEDVLRRPTTPATLSMRRSSPQVWTRQTTDTSSGSVDESPVGPWVSSPRSPSHHKGGKALAGSSSPSHYVDHYASHMLNEVMGINKSVAEAVSFPPILPREPEKFGNRSVNEFIVAFSSRPKISRTPEHGGRTSQSPYPDVASHSDDLQNG